jgi:hypothetical protein
MAKWRQKGGPQKTAARPWRSGGKSAAIVRQKGGTAVKKNGGELAANFCGPPWSERKCFSFSFLLILDEGGFRGGRAKSVYFLLAATACPRP